MDQFVRKNDPTPDLLAGCGTLFFEDPHMSYHHSAFGIRVNLLDNAFTPGTVVPCYYVETRYGDIVAAFNHLHHALDGQVTPAGIRDYLQTLTFTQGRYGYEPIEIGHNVQIHLSERSGSQTFSPFAVNRFKPLTEMPKKWTMAHCKRALANGQFENLRCNGVYSDDYAFDDAVDYSRGPVDALIMLEKVVSSPSGWRTSLDSTGNIFHLCCHTFDNNSAKLKIAA
jgi:hypothetical protein